jgi:dihydroneopterin aldolase
MMTISIKDFELHAHHGVYAEEKRTGQLFRLQCDMIFDPGEGISRLDQTIDYTCVVALIREIMAEPEDLLESVVKKIADRIRVEHPLVCSVDISIEKCTPPIPSFSGRVGVRYRIAFT